MIKLEKRISKWNFKKIAITFIIAAVITAIGCVAAAGFVYKDRIAFAWQYAHVSEAAEKQDATNLQTELDKLASSSSDVVDILMLDSSNNVVYSAKNSEFSAGQFNLSRAGANKEYLISDTDSNVVFKYVRDDEFMLNSVFNTDFGKIRDEYRDVSFFENDFGRKTVYILSFLGEKDSGSKIYIISSPTTVAGGVLTLKIVMTVAVLFFMIYWVLVALWAYQNAAKSKLYPVFWGIIVLLTNVVGIIVYLLYKRENAACSVCGASQSRQHLYCTSCGAKLGATCKNCGAHIGKKDLFCPNCGGKIQ
ncbi:MAG: zinc ribbon domain-containing protein [Clostridiaceae bacterium]|nr:zinc ribbon domain-containing protein [Clostridiaceae bacterium]